MDLAGESWGLTIKYGNWDFTSESCYNMDLIGESWGFTSESWDLTDLTIN
jgi:hypothetical protein